MKKPAIDADVEVISSTKRNRQPTPAKATEQKVREQQAGNPFAAFGANSMEGLPDLSKLVDLSPRQRLMLTLIRLFSNPKLRFLKSKWCILPWIIVAIIVLALLLTFGTVFLAFKFLKSLLSPYLEIFKRK